MIDEEVKEAFEKQKREGPYYHGSGQPYCFDCDKIVTADHNYFISTGKQPNKLWAQSHSPTGATHTLAWDYAGYCRLVTEMVINRMAGK